MCVSGTTYRRNPRALLHIAPRAAGAVITRHARVIGLVVRVLADGPVVAGQLAVHRRRHLDLPRNAHQGARARRYAQRPAVRGVAREPAAAGQLGDVTRLDLVGDPHTEDVARPGDR